MCKALEVVVVWGKLFPDASISYTGDGSIWKMGSSIRMSGEVGRDFQ